MTNEEARALTPGDLVEFTEELGGFSIGDEAPVMRVELTESSARIWFHFPIWNEVLYVTPSLLRLKSGPDHAALLLEAFAR